MARIKDLEKTALECWGQVVGELGPDLKETRALDPSGCATFILLRAKMDNHLRGLSFTAYDLLHNTGKVAQQLGPLYGLREILHSSEVATLTKKLERDVLDAGVLYQLDERKKAGLKKLVRNPQDFARLVVDALRCIPNMGVHHFSLGEVGTLALNPNIEEFWNVQSLLRAMEEGQLPGASMVLVRHPADSCQPTLLGFAVQSKDTRVLIARRPLPYEDPEEVVGTHFPASALLSQRQGGVGYLFAKTREAYPIAPGIHRLLMCDLTPQEFLWALLVVRNLQGMTAGEEISCTSPPLELPLLTRAEILSGLTGRLVERYGGKISPLTEPESGWGTKEQLLADRLWRAQTRYTTLIEQLANAEYQRTKKDIRLWCQAHAEANQDKLLDAVAREGLDGATVKVGFGLNFQCIGGPFDVDSRTHIGRYCGEHLKWECPTGDHTPAVVYASIQGNTPSAFASIFGVSEGDLPWPLQTTSQPAPPIDLWRMGETWEVFVAVSEETWSARRRHQKLLPKKWAQRGQDGN